MGVECGSVREGGELTRSTTFNRPVDIRPVAAIFDPMVERSSEHLDTVFAALADPTRRAIVEALSVKPSTVGELAAPYDISLAATSKHIKVLERAGFVKRTIDGRVHRCELDARPMQAGLEWMRRYERWWSRTPDVLEDPPKHEDAPSVPPGAAAAKRGRSSRKHRRSMR